MPLLLTGAGPSGTGSFSGPLDAYTANLIFAASPARRLLASYSGPLIRVLRSLDSTESDIGATSTGALDTSALAAFIGAGNGFITKVYDQKATAGDIVQATASAQPKIVNAGTLLTEGGKPTMNFDGVDDGLSVTYAGPGTFTAYTVAKLQAAGSYPMMVVHRQSSLELRGNASSGQLMITGPSTSIVSGTSCVNEWNQITWQFVSGGNQSLWKNAASMGTPVAAGTTTISEITLGCRGASFYANQRVSEHLVFNTAHNTTARQAIEANQKAFYGTL